MADPAPNADFIPAATARDLAVLAELAEVGLRLTQAIERHVLAGEQVQALNAEADPYSQIFPPVDFAVLAVAFNRIARAVRMTVAMKVRLARPRRTPACASSSPAAPRLESAGRDDKRADREGRESLFDTPDAEEDVSRPAVEIVAQIAADLGVSVDLSAFADEASDGAPGGAPGLGPAGLRTPPDGGDRSRFLLGRAEEPPPDPLPTGTRPTLE